MANRLEKKPLALRQLPDGRTLHTSIFRITGPSPGPEAYIQAGIHGAELQGSLVVYEILRRLAAVPIRGTLNLVALANPQATAQKIGPYTYGRFDPTTGENWNRAYQNFPLGSIERFAEHHATAGREEIAAAFKREIASFLDAATRRTLPTAAALCTSLQKLASRADVVLDLHTGPESVRYLYCPKNKEAEGRLLGFAYSVLIDPLVFAGALDEACFVPWNRLEEVFCKNGRRIDLSFSAYTLELGSEERIDAALASEEAERIIDFLAFKGLLDALRAAPAPPDGFSCSLEDFKPYFSPFGGLVDYLKKPGDHFSKGECMAMFYLPGNIENFDDLAKGTAAFNAPEDGIVVSRFPSAAVASGTKLFEVMTNAIKRS